MKGGASRLLAILVACLLVALAEAQRKGRRRDARDDSQRKKVTLPHHSFSLPLEYHTLLDDWVVTGASIFERGRLLMHPGVSDRAGFLWSKSPLLTNDFEVVLNFRVSGDQDAGRVPTDQAFAVWYVHENMSAAFSETIAIKAKTWTSGMAQQGFDFVGSKAKFNGFGVVLSVADADKKPNAVVSTVENDGTQTLAYGKDVPAASAKPFDFRNTLNAAMLRIRVRPESIEGYTKQSPSLSWQECFKIDRKGRPVQTGGYVGFTAFSGTQSEGSSSDLLSLIQVDVINFDENTIGESMKAIKNEDGKDVTSKIQDAYREMLLDDKRHFADQKSQTDHLSRLTTMIGDYINRTKPEDDKLWRDLGSLERRMTRLTTDCQTVIKETSLLMNRPGSKGGEQDHQKAVELLKSDIIGIRRLLVRDSATYREKMDSLQKNTGEVKAKVTEAKPGETIAAIEKQSDNLAKMVNSRGTQMSWMLISLLAAVLAIGGLMYNRMNYYEKKHFI